MLNPNTVELMKKVVETLSLRERADAEQGAAALRRDIKKHNIDLQDPKQLEAFMMGYGWVLLAAQRHMLDRAINATGLYFIEEDIHVEPLES